ncbi:MAG: response regulator transcription factor [Clostridia bacterium]|nr:response regulator transcription factor [Clostridia bacterium]
MANILIVEDERAIADLLAMNLQAVGHGCTVTMTGKAAVTAAKEQGFDLMLLDIMLPDMEGFAVAERVRDVPIIFLTARGADADKIRGFGLGADDYITKPFSVSELLLRVQAVLRRTHREDKSYTLGPLSVRFDAHEVTLDGERVELTSQEFALLRTLIENRNVCLSRQRLLSEAWGMDFVGESRTVDVHIQKLRHKLRLEDAIQTVYKSGYRFVDKP